MEVNRRSWVQNLFRPLAVAAMMGCVALSMVDLVRLLFPTWNGTYIIVGCVLAAMEAAYSYRLIRAQELRGDDVLRFRAVEVAMLFILLRIGRYIGAPWSQVIADVRTLPHEPGNLFDLETSAAFVLAFAAWLVATRTTHDLERIGEPPIKSSYYVPPTRSLVNRFFQGGMVLLIVTGITRIGTAALLALEWPAVPGLVLNVLVYFVLGLVMMGQIQFARLYQRWGKEGVKVSQEVAGRWARYSLIFLGLAASMAFLLPTRYTVPLLDVVATVVGFLLYVANLLIYVLLVIAFLLLMPLAWLLGSDRMPPPTPPIGPPQFVQPTSGGDVPGWLEAARSLLFWAVALSVIVYVVRAYLRDRPELLDALTSLKPIRALGRLLSGLWRRLAALAGAVREHLPRPRLPRGPDKAPGETPSRRIFRFFRLNALSSRERTLYYYLSILQRAGQLGYPRRRSQTPYEYDTTLGPHVSQAQEELDRLTEAFVETRYSSHAVDREREERVRRDWKRVRAALRTLQQASRGGEAPASNAEAGP